MEANKYSIIGMVTFIYISFFNTLSPFHLNQERLYKYLTFAWIQNGLGTNKIKLHN